MCAAPDRRSRKRLATRQSISDVATRLFLERGFDQVTIDEIAAAADVGRMTVFNHFPRKEDLFFDRDEEGREILRDAVRRRDPRISPIEGLRRLAHRMVAERSPYLEFSGAGQDFVETVRASETLKARARAIRDELVQLMAATLTEDSGRGSDDPDAHLAASMLMATWTAAFLQAHASFRRTGAIGEARAVFLALIDKGSEGVEAAMAGTPYARQSASGSEPFR